MDLSERIARRQSGTSDASLVVDWRVLSPASHLAEPVGRGAVLEKILDAVEPAFAGRLPPELALVGPPGTGKSALVTALFAQLNDQVGETSHAIGTTTRAGSTNTPWFVHVDARRADSEFRIYHRLLDAVAEESIPERGVGTDELRERLMDKLRRPARAVVAVDHLSEADFSIEMIRNLLEPVANSVTLFIVDRTPPPEWDGETTTVEPYRRHALADILTERASRGLTTGAVDHEQIRRIAGWAEGNAHDALAVLFGAADAAVPDSTTISDSDIDAGIDAVPDDGIHLGRVLALPENRRDVLAMLLTLSDEDTQSITSTAEAIAERASLSQGTVTRFLYELSEDGILRRETAAESSGVGRTPSQVRPCFPTRVFRRLHHMGIDDE